MNKYIKWSLAILAAVAVGVFLLGAVGKTFIREITQDVDIKESSTQLSGIQPGDSAPYWQLEDLDGDAVALSDFLGKPLVLIFWASWNLQSVDQLNILDEYVSGHPNSFFDIAMINNQEDRSVVNNFFKRGGYNLRTFLDETGEIGELYKVQTLPITYFVDKDGAVQGAFVGVLSADMLEDLVVLYY